MEKGNIDEAPEVENNSKIIELAIMVAGLIAPLGLTFLEDA